MRVVTRANNVVRHRGVVVRGVTTLGVIGLVLGVPLAMLAIHAPSPLEQIRNVTGHPDDLRRAFDERVSDKTIAGVVAAIAWLMWTWFVACVIAEVVGRVRGRTPTRVPGSRHLQSLVAGLLGASLAFGVSSRQAPPLRLASPPCPCRLHTSSPPPSHRSI